MENYKHVPLDSERQFRVIRLQPSIHFDSAIQCELRTFNLDKAPPYEALSYVWGSSTPDQPIKCHGKPLLVTENCLSALQHLRHKFRTRILWIDAICIDQGTLSERNHQVRLMGDIYSYAKAVLIWIGKGDAQTHSFFIKLRGLMSSYRAFHMKTILRGVFAFLRHRSEFSMMNFSMRSLSKYRRKPMWTLKETDYSALLVLGGDWFSRVWALQEYILARRAVFVCGFDSLVWDSILGDVLDLLEFSTPAIEERYALEKIKFTRTCKEKWRSYHQKVEQDKPLFENDCFDVLYMLLCSARTRNASELRDKIFSVHDMMQKININLEIPDYSQTLATIYESSTVEFINQSRSLSILNFAHSRHKSLDLPSWVPDYGDSDTKFPGFLGSRMALNHIKNDVIHSPGKLLVDGIIVDVIQEVCPQIEKETQLMDTVSWMELASTADLHGWEMEEALGSFNKNKEIPDITWIPAHHAFDSSMIDTMEGLLLVLDVIRTTWSRSTSLQDGTSPESEATSNTITYEDIERILLDMKSTDPELYLRFQHTFDEMQVKSTGYTLFTTECNHLGMTRGDVLPGDVIVYFPGTLDPIVLRSSSNHVPERSWTVVGTARTRTGRVETWTRPEINDGMWQSFILM
jgi:hypothetical protein